MKTTKRFAFSLIVAVLCAALLAGCSLPALPDGVTEDALATAAADTIAQLSAGEYDALMESCDKTMQESLPADALSEAWEPTRTELGAFVEQTDAQYLGKDGFAMAVITAKYENKSIVFTLSYNTDLQLSGLYFK